MGHQIIKEPGKDTYAVFSSGTSRWIRQNATREELIEYYAERAARDARKSAAETIDAVDEDPRTAYFDFAMTFEEANAESVAHGGDDLTKV